MFAFQKITEVCQAAYTAWGASKAALGGGVASGVQVAKQALDEMKLDKQKVNLDKARRAAQASLNERKAKRQRQLG